MLDLLGVLLDGIKCPQMIRKNDVRHRLDARWWWWLWWWIHPA